MSARIRSKLLATIWASTSNGCCSTFQSPAPPFLHGFFQKGASIPNSIGVRGLPRATTKHVISRISASGGFVAVSVNPSSPAAETVSSMCARTVERRNPPAMALDRRKVLRQLQGASQKAHYSSRRDERSSDGSNNGRTSKTEPNNSDRRDDEDTEAKSSIASKASEKAGKGLAAASAVNRHVMDRLPHMPHLHRPNKEELLAAATGFWSRLKVRFKWFSIRSARPFNMDEIGAFFSWFVLGHVIWIIVGTTTFFSLAILAVNTVFAQGESHMYPSSLVQC